MLDDPMEKRCDEAVSMVMGGWKSCRSVMKTWSLEAATRKGCPGIVIKVEVDLRYKCHIRLYEANLEYGML